MKKIIIFLITILSIFTLTGCNEQNVESSPLDVVEFADQTVLYDGKKHSIEVLNLPEGYSVSYSGNEKSELGTYEITANIFKDKVLVLTLKATLNIVEEEIVELPEELKGISFKSIKVPYTGQEYGIEVENLPEGYTVSYSGNNVSEIGIHNVTANIFKDKVLVVSVSAKITILEKTSVELPLV